MYDCLCMSGFTGETCEIDINECDSNPCKLSGSFGLNNHDICIDGPNRYDCMCGLGYIGRNCEIEIDECLSNPCNEPNGRCLDGIGAYQCECLPGYSFYKNCAEKKNPCNTNKCQNLATCVPSQKGFDFTCVCQDGFTGKYCQTTINECKSEPCLNDGVCTDYSSSFSCSCKYPWTGPFCDVNIDFCNSLPCKYDGTCQSQIDRSNPNTMIDLYKYKCYCQPGRTGKVCEIQIDECKSYPCGFHATCEDLLDGYLCHCHPHYTGQHCETRIDFCNYPKENGYCQDGTSKCANVYQESSRISALFGPDNGYV